MFLFPKCGLAATLASFYTNMVISNTYKGFCKLILSRKNKKSF